MSEKNKRDFENPTPKKPMSRDKALISWFIISIFISPLITWIIGVITLFRQKDTLGLGGLSIIGVGCVTWLLYIVLFLFL